MKIYKRDTAAAYFLWMYILISPLAIIFVIQHYSHSCDNKLDLTELRQALESVAYQQEILQKLVQEYYNENLGAKTGASGFGPAELKTGNLKRERESLDENLSWIEDAVKRLRRAIIDQQTFKRLRETTCKNDFMHDLLKEVGLAQRLKLCETQLTDCDAKVSRMNSTNADMALKVRAVESECNATRSELSDVCCSTEDRSLGSMSWMSCTVSGSFLAFITAVLVVIKRAWRGGHHLVPSVFTVLSESKALMWISQCKKNAFGWFNPRRDLEVTMTLSNEKNEHSIFAS